jgi:hypothetical protein
MHEWSRFDWLYWPNWLYWLNWLYWPNWLYWRLSAADE